MEQKNDLLLHVSTLRTYAAFNAIVEHFKKICKTFEIAVQIILIAFYVCSVIINVERTHLLVINGVLLLIALTTFVFTMVALGKKEARSVKKRVSKVFHFIKLFIRVVTIGLSVYELVLFGANDLKVISTAVMLITFFVQIVLEFARYLLNKYIYMLRVGIEMDVEYVVKSETVTTLLEVKENLQNPAAYIMETLNRPLEAIVGKEPKKAPVEEPKEKYSEKEEKLRKRYEEIAVANAGEKKRKKKDNKAQKEEEKAERRKDAAHSLKKNLGKVVEKVKDKTKKK